MTDRESKHEEKIKMSTKFVKTRGNRFTIGDKEIIFNGIGIGSWFNMEHFMTGPQDSR